MPESLQPKKRPESVKADAGPRLEFRPDQRQVRRAAWTRRILLGAAIVVLGAALVLLLRFRPGPGMTPETGAAGDSAVLPAPGASAGTPAEARVAPSGQVAVRAAAELVQAVRGFRGQWQRAGVLAAAAVLSGDSAGVSRARLDSAQAALDSAGHLLRLARERQRALGGLYSKLEARVAYRLSVVNTAAKRLLELLTQDERDRKGQLACLVQAVEAQAAADEAEAEVKLNTAEGFARVSEERQPRLARQAAQVDDAVRALGK